MQVKNPEDNISRSVSKFLAKASSLNPTCNRISHSHENLGMGERLLPVYSGILKWLVSRQMWECHVFKIISREIDPLNYLLRLNLKCSCLYDTGK
jgi:hypothetical protein